MTRRRLGIRAVGAGAITDALDRELAAEDSVAQDFARAAPVREIARTLGISTATLAHRYALGMPGVDSVVLGVKNRTELAIRADEFLAESYLRN